jgi:ketosteroid isomerase-like protein
MDTGAVVASFFARWGVQDIELTLALFHDSFVYKVHASRDVLPFSGETRGKEANRELMFTILADFDIPVYEPLFIRVTGNVARVHVRFVYWHRATGEVLEGTRRLVFIVRDGLILRIDGYHDDRLVAAFLRLTRHRMAMKQIVRAPALPSGRATEGSGAGI